MNCLLCLIQSGKFIRHGTGRLGIAHLKIEILKLVQCFVQFRFYLCCFCQSLNGMNLRRHLLRADDVERLERFLQRLLT